MFDLCRLRAFYPYPGLIKASEPKPRVSPIGVLSAGCGKSSHETFAASRTLGKPRTVPWTSNLLTEFQREHKEKLFSLSQTTCLWEPSLAMAWTKTSKKERRQAKKATFA
jgi:hypothetical protein